MAKTSKKDESTQDKSAPEKSAEATAKTADAKATDNQSIPASTGLKGPAVATEKAVKTSNIKTRVEEDLLGKLEVPEDAYYGVHTMRALDNFQISYVTVNSIPEFIRGMVMVKRPRPWPTVVCTPCQRRRLKPLSGHVTRFWKRVVAWTSSRWMFSREALVPRPT